jgi:hypothetical protein
MQSPCDGWPAALSRRDRAITKQSNDRDPHARRVDQRTVPRVFSTKCGLHGAVWQVPPTFNKPSA